LISHVIIEWEEVCNFYVGNQGEFDTLVKNTLRQIKKEYPHITYSVVLAYRPVNKRDYIDYSDTIFPEELAMICPQYAIVKRNLWMIDHSEFVIVYVDRSYGGAASFKRISEKKGKRIINLADNNGFD